MNQTEKNKEECLNNILEEEFTRFSKNGVIFYTPNEKKVYSSFELRVIADELDERNS